MVDIVSKGIPEKKREESGEEDRIERGCRTENHDEDRRVYIGMAMVREAGSCGKWTATASLIGWVFVGEDGEKFGRVPTLKIPLMTAESHDWPRSDRCWRWHIGPGLPSNSRVAAPLFICHPG